MTKNNILSAIAIFLFVLSSCTREEAPQRQLSNISEESIPPSPYTALMKDDLEYWMKVKCERAKDFISRNKQAAQNEKNENVKEVLEFLIKRYDVECRVYTLAEKQTLKVHEYIKRTNKEPDFLYTFSVFVFSNAGVADATYIEKDVGIFMSLEACNEVEKMAHNIQMPTTICHKWEGTFLPKGLSYKNEYEKARNSGH